MSPPRIAVLIGRYPEDRYSVNRGYVDALLAVGAFPVLVPAGPGTDVDAVLDAVGEASGVVFTGGGDMSPEHYGGPDHPSLMELDPDRDDVELAVVRAATDRGQPVLGICRGHQALAVALGGSLVTDVVSVGRDNHWYEAEQHEPVHGIEVDAGSLASIAAAGAVEVNSIHHQAVADAGRVLRATAWSPDGVIEAVEADGILGVQWHPERLLAHDGRHLAPFRWVVGAAAGAGAT
jgi:putative glutamine amidotransferase